MVGAIESGQTLSSLDQGGAPITYIFVELFHMDNVAGLIGIAVLYCGTYFFAIRHSQKRAKALRESKAATEQEISTVETKKSDTKKTSAKQNVSKNTNTKKSPDKKKTTTKKKV